MDILLSFLGGAILAAIIAWFIAKGAIKTRVQQAESTANTKIEVLKAKEEAQEKAMEEMDKRFQETLDKVSAQVKNDTNEMLEKGQDKIIKKGNEDIEGILNPLKEQLNNLREEMGKGREAQIQLKTEMEKHVDSMLKQSEAAQKSTDELTNALKHGNKVQGIWGETILEELLDSQGLKKGIHFDVQATIRDDKGKAVKSEGDDKKLVPDIILHLGDDREVIIDSKVSLTAFLEYVNAETDEARKAALKEHVQSIKRHFRELAHKDYSSYIQPPKVSAGFVMMFVPNSGALWAALRYEPGLWREAAGLGVYIADEQSLYGALRIVDLTWRQVKQAESQQKVFELVDQLLKRVGDYVVDYNNLGAALKTAVKAYNDGRKKLAPEGQSIVTSAKSLIKLGGNGKQMISTGSKKKEPLAKLLGIETPSALETGLSGDPADDVPALPESGEE